MSTHKKLAELERDICSMHQPHIPRSEMNKVEFDRLYSQCPCHETACNEDDLQRIFGAGDEQAPRRASIYRKWDNTGHGRRDFE